MIAAGIMSPAECPLGSGLRGSAVAGDVWQPDGTRVELAMLQSSAAATPYRTNAAVLLGSIDPDFTVRSGLPHTLCMLETESIRWKWCCAQLIGRQMRPAIQTKGRPREGGFWIVCRELVLKLRHGLQFILRGLIHRVIGIPTLTGAGCRGCRGGSCRAGGGSRGSVWSGISSRRIRRCGRC